MATLRITQPLEIDCPELREAIDLADAASELIRTGEEQAKEAKLRVRDAARKFLMAADGDAELISRAGYVYWKMPDVPAAIIAAVLLGDEKKATLVAGMLPPTDAGCQCSGCGVAFTFKNRSEIASHMSSVRRHARCSGDPPKFICGKCRDIEVAKSTAGWEEQQRKENERAYRLHSMPYREYLLTEEWLQTRNRKLRQAGFQCQLCNGRGRLDVHHRTYERRGFEDMADLTVLCRPCHAKFHDKLP